MSFITFLLYIVCVFIRPQEWWFPVYAWPLINVFGTATLVFLAFEAAGKPPSKQWVRVPQGWMMLAFFAAILMSHIAHHYFAGVVDAWDKNLPTFILFYAILNALNTEKRLQITYWLIVLMIAFMALQGIDQARTGFGWGGQKICTEFNQIGTEKYQIDRITWVGIFEDPNDLALVFVMAVGFVLPFVFTRINILLWSLNVAILGLLGYGIYLTNSRGGQLALIAAVFVFFVRKTKKYIWGGVLGGIVTAAILALGPSRMGFLSASEESASNRLDLWYGGLQLFKSNPFFGIGYNLFLDELPQTAHNSYVLAVTELGFAGFFVWMAFIYYSMKGLNLVQHGSKTLSNYALGLQAGLAGFCAAAFFLSRTYIILPYLIFAMAGSILWLSAAANDSIKIRFDGKDLWNVFWLSVAVLIIIFVTIKIGLN